MTTATEPIIPESPQEAPEWRHRDEWTAGIHSNVCRVQVSRHPTYDGNGWAVYALIFKDHPLFAVLLAADTAKTPYYDVPEISAMPLHCGCTYCEPVFQDGGIVSFKVGADYSHLHDDYFARQDRPDMVPQVFDDAKELLAHLNRLAVAAGKKP